jgi:acyl carrier protein
VDGVSFVEENMDEIIASVKEFILAEFLPGEDPEALTSTTPLMSSGILDSLATLRLVGFIEEKFNVIVEPHELTDEYLGTLNSIAELIHTRV